MVKVACASTIVQNPRSKLIATNSSKSDRPVITSGMTSGAKIMPENSVRPRNRPIRTRTSAAMVPNTVASVAEMKATFSVIHAASISCSFSSSPAYHLVENPPHTVTSFDSLKE